MAIAGLALMINGQPGIFIAVTGVFIAANAQAEIAVRRTWPNNSTA